MSPGLGDGAGLFEYRLFLASVVLQVRRDHADAAQFFLAFLVATQNALAVLADALFLFADHFVLGANDIEAGVSSVEGRLFVGRLLGFLAILFGLHGRHLLLVFLIFHDKNIGLGMVQFKVVARSRPRWLIIEIAGPI